MDMQLVFFILDRPVVMNEHFVLYSFEKHHKWKRLVARSLPDGLSSVLVEITFDPEAGKPEQNIVDIVANELTTELKLFRFNEILTTHTKVVRKAYPIYEIGFENRVASIIQELESDRFQLAGRQGRFLYTDTNGAIRTAINAADKILHAISNDVDRL